MSETFILLLHSELRLVNGEFWYFLQAAKTDDNLTSDSL
jgi:hypothetical protein